MERLIVIAATVFSMCYLLCCVKFTQSKTEKEKDHLLIFTNAKIYTLNNDKPLVDSIVVQGDKILFVGDGGRALQFKTKHTKVIDLNKNTLIPGLVDAHAHIFSLGKSLMTLNLKNTNSYEEIVELVRDQTSRTHRMNWILGRGWDQNNWSLKAFPTNNKLSEVSPNHPVLLTRVDGHAALANKKALEISGILKETPDPDGGQMIRDASGELTGVLIDNAINLVSKRIPKYSKDQIKGAILKAQDSCLSYGLTQIHDAGIEEEHWEAFKELSKDGKLKLRVYAMMLPDTSLYKKLIKEGPQIGLNDGKLTLRTIKMFADGALGSRGALLTKSYSDKPGHNGLLLTPVEKMQKVTDEGIKAGFQIATHAIGDGGNRIVVDTYEKALKSNNVDDPRLRIEHVQVINPKDVKRMKAYNIIASMQPTHCTSDMPWAPDRLGGGRIAWAYSWKTIINEGIKFAAGSDFPVESNDPLLGIYAAVTRKKTDGLPKEGYTPDEKLTINEAVESFTKGAAYSSFEEKLKGELKEGYKADFTILSKDIFKVKPKEILNTKVLMTVIDGSIVYSCDM